MEIAEKITKRAHQDQQTLVDRIKESVTGTEAVREGKAWVIPTHKLVQDRTTDPSRSDFNTLVKAVFSSG